MKNIINEVFGKLEPIVNVKTGEIEKFEMLVRHNKYTPGEILANVNQADLFIKQLEEAVKISNKHNINISLNIDNNILHSNKCLLELSKYQKEELKGIQFELLETNINLDKLKEFIKHIQKLGIKINVDDFGSKEQTMKRVKDIKQIVGKKLKSIKLDGQLVLNYCDGDEKAIEMIKEIKKYADENKIEIVAEFVENLEIFNKIKDVCDLTQGYMFVSLYTNLENFDTSLKMIKELTSDKLKDNLKTEQTKTKRVYKDKILGK